MDTGNILVLYKSGIKIASGQHFDSDQVGVIKKCAVNLMNNYFKSHKTTILIRSLTDDEKLMILQSVINQAGYKLYKHVFNPALKLNKTHQVDKVAQ